MENHLRTLRLSRGLSQGELADLAGVSRQLVGAVEAGRHMPNVDAAIRLARVLGASVETLFAGPHSRSVLSTSIGADVAPGQPVMIGLVGERRVHAPLRNLLGPAEGWAAADGFVGPHGVESYSDVDVEGFIVAGCDPILGLASSVAMGRTGPRIVPVHLSTGTAIDALTRGVVHAVVVHGPVKTLPKPPVAVGRWRVASWQVGVASKDKRVRSVVDLAERNLATAQREPGAGTQRALTRALRRVGASSLPGPIVEGHVDAARYVVAGVKAGVTMEAAAHAFSLDFFPLETHVSELWIDLRYLGDPGAVALLSALSSSALMQRAQHLPGYDVGAMGTEVTV